MNTRHDYDALRAIHRATMRENERLKKTLVQTVADLGGVATAEVSIAFLEEVPAEARLVREERDRLRAALEAIEWLPAWEWHTGIEVKGCPWCRRSSKSGHAPDCQRQLALRAGGGE